MAGDTETQCELGVLLSLDWAEPRLHTNFVVKELSAAPSNYFVYREQSRTFQDIGLYTGDSVNVTGVGNGFDGSPQGTSLAVLCGSCPASSPAGESVVSATTGGSGSRID